MIRAQVRELVAARATLEHLNNSPMPAVTATRFATTVSQLNAVLSRFESEAEGKRANYTLDRDEPLEPDDQREYDAFVEERLNRTFEIGADPVAVQDLGPLVALTPGQAAGLYWLLYDKPESGA